MVKLLNYCSTFVLTIKLLARASSATDKPHGLFVCLFAKYFISLRCEKPSGAALRLFNAVSNPPKLV